MHNKNIAFWQHPHIFGQDQVRAGEHSTILVVGLTTVMMVIQIAAGILFGSMALLADGLHMASHSVALGINVFAYIYARRHAQDKRFSFGTGKVNALGGFTGAILLLLFAIMMGWESSKRLVSPVEIAFNQAIFVAVMGLIVNGISMFLLDIKRNAPPHSHKERAHPHEHAADHNLQSAYLHVLADALTSVLAIVALLAAKYFGFIWMDPLMGIVGAVLVSRWSMGLLKQTSNVLLDKESPKYLLEKIRKNIECDGDSRITDLHIWSVGPNRYSVNISVVAQNPLEPEQYKQLLASEPELAHITVEIFRCKATH